MFMARNENFKKSFSHQHKIFCLKIFNFEEGLNLSKLFEKLIVIQKILRRGSWNSLRPNTARLFQALVRENY